MTKVGRIPVAALSTLGALTPVIGRSFDSESLEALRRGSAGIELAGILVATVDAHGRVASAATGCARFARDGVACELPLRTDGLLRIASISKLIAAAEIVQDFRRRRISLDTDVSSLLGFRLRNPQHPSRPITVRQLLNHSSSIVDSDRYWLAWSGRIDAHTQDTHTFDPVHAPGDYFRYSNFNYVLLGQILERVTQRRFNEQVEQHQFAPLKIAANYNWQTAAPIDAERVVTLYRRQADDAPWDSRGPWIPQVDDFRGQPPNKADLRAYRPGTNGSVFSPHGGLRIALPDLARWLAKLDRRTFAALRERSFVVNSDASNGDSEGGFYRQFGLGLQAFEWPGIGKVWGHFGEAYGLRAGLLRAPGSGQVWAYAITGYGDDPAKYPAALAGFDRPQAALLELLAAETRRP